MLYKMNLGAILFLDVETVPQAAHFDELNAAEQTLWEQKTQYQRKEEFTPATPRWRSSATSARIDDQLHAKKPISSNSNTVWSSAKFLALLYFHSVGSVTKPASTGLL